MCLTIRRIACNLVCTTSVAPHQMDTSGTMMKLHVSSAYALWGLGGYGSISKSSINNKWLRYGIFFVFSCQGRRTDSDVPWFSSLPLSLYPIYEYWLSIVTTRFPLNVDERKIFVEINERIWIEIPNAQFMIVQLVRTLDSTDSLDFTAYEWDHKYNSL